MPALIVAEVIPAERIRSLKRTCPFFTAFDIVAVTGFRLGEVEAALRELPQDRSDRMLVYALREIAD